MKIKLILKILLCSGSLYKVTLYGSYCKRELRKGTKGRYIKFFKVYTTVLVYRLNAKILYLMILCYDQTIFNKLCLIFDKQINNH